MIILSAGCFLFLGVVSAFYPQKMDSLLFAVGLYLGMCLMALYVVVNGLKKFKLRLKEITGE